MWKPAAGFPFVNRAPLPSALVNTLVNEMAALATASGAALDAGNDAQLLAAVRAMFLRFDAAQTLTAAQQAQAFSNMGASVSKAANGYQRLPGGLIIQWGYGASPGYSQTNISFPIAFPNICCSVSIAGDISALASVQATFRVNSVSLTQFQCDMGYVLSNKTGVYWLAIGY